jgi:hypothetical protein
MQDDERLMDLAKRGGATELIGKLNKGLDTVIHPEREVHKMLSSGGGKDNPLHQVVKQLEKRAEVSGMSLTHFINLNLTTFTFVQEGNNSASQRTISLIGYPTGNADHYRTDLGFLLDSHPVTSAWFVLTNQVRHSIRKLSGSYSRIYAKSDKGRP